MKVWIDQDLCTGDGLCEEIAPDVFVGLDDGLFYVKEGDKINKGDPIITLESDKSSVEVPSTINGSIEKVKIKIVFLLP